MDTSKKLIIDKLIGADSDTWSKFIFNLDMAKQIKNIDRNIAATLLTAGLA